MRLVLLFLMNILIWISLFFIQKAKKEEILEIDNYFKIQPFIFDLEENKIEQIQPDKMVLILSLSIIDEFYWIFRVYPKKDWRKQKLEQSLKYKIIDSFIEKFEVEWDDEKLR